MLVLDWLRNDLELKNDERVMGLLYHLGIADMDDLERITGWTRFSIQEAIKQARKRANRYVGQGTAPKDVQEQRRKERDQWVRIQKTKKGGPRDRSKVNTEYTIHGADVEGEKGIIRAGFEHQRQEPNFSSLNF